ncbi:type II-A CRISPR-associated protein Csn2 [Enterococcus dongliensis]|uniref:Type II-A CRISPR-associated protein Csn2 n=1 Tax=Enterococcus dongliensis TaxID=2559925 RepID=A0AAP5NK07_9ENTE|nr:type II-A CRISPR-associated protein Csn2 [Enterococcus dongliensis]MDT2597780.1 type II-A CRISPR-associated protein Csn2 [Enterococcus dongliensis]MDT2604500.1 type II-A CRISPR-associated protein Csn2 [Enterococcus dongliensis]MDT2613498.1 type II-A CRISPR-associated protein Csn2 [Enterococcus dongliensis]MDT2634919.1 type II-A CRISPR-associated protein Csn2 [Enterococcus dongliensis]MDT2638064.1 type II-A CRISPR-associated protein Csn2 [Enterococcus dongliensis]
MMKLNFEMLDQPIELNSATILTVEDTKIFALLTKYFYQYQDESELRLFDDKQKSIKPSELMLVTDVLGYDINSAATLKLIYTDLELQLNERPEVKSMIDKLTATISELIGYELLEHELDLECDEITIIELFKALGIKIETTSDSIFEKLVEIVQVFKNLTKKKLLVFINVCSYLTKEELVELNNYISLYNTTVLYLEPRQVAETDQYILDEDYFLNFVLGN